MFKNHNHPAEKRDSVKEAATEMEVGTCLRDVLFIYFDMEREGDHK